MLISERIPNSLVTLKNTFRKVFSPKKSLSSVLHADLAKQTQNNSSGTQFANKIELLVASLNELQIAELGCQNREAVLKMNDQVSLSTFKNGLNEPHRTTLLAARPKSLNEAIQVASEVIPQQNSIQHFNKNKRLSNNRAQRNYANTYNNNRSSNNN